MTTRKVDLQLADRFISLANQMHETEDLDKHLVAAGLMAAAGVYNAFRFITGDDTGGSVATLKGNLYGQGREFGAVADRFIDLARTVSAEDGLDYQAAAAAVIAASTIYVTFASAGNQGYLQEGGIKKATAKFGEILSASTAGQLPGEYLHPMIEVWSKNLAALQQAKRRGLDTE